MKQIRVVDCFRNCDSQEELWTARKWWHIESPQETVHVWLRFVSIRVLVFEVMAEEDVKVVNEFKG